MSRALCERCWGEFPAAVEESCPICRSEKPAQGWRTLPYLFRNRYWFLKLLGRGGMGAVFLAYDPHAAAGEAELAADEERATDPYSALVAIKVVQQKGSRDVPEHQQRSMRKLLKEVFNNEVAATRMVSRYKRLFVDAKGHDDLDPAYLAMEYIHQGASRFHGDVPWQTVSALLGKGAGKTIKPVPAVEVAQIGIALLQGVGAMAQHNIVHNDLKPDNIFVRRVTSEGKEQYEVKIMDLGVWTLDQSAAETESVLTGVGDVTGGTADYMSPEQTALFANLPSERRILTRLSDLFAVASVLWELVTGAVPFPSLATKGRPYEEAYRERMARLATPPSRPPSMPEGLYVVLVKALAREPSDRWADAYEMREKLKHFVQGERQHLETIEAEIVALRERLEPFSKLLQRLVTLQARVKAAGASPDPTEQGAAAQPLALELQAITSEFTTLTPGTPQGSARRAPSARPVLESSAPPRSSAPAASQQPASRSQPRTKSVAPKEAAPEEQAPDSQPIDEQPIDEQPIDEQPIDEQPIDEKLIPPKRSAAWVIIPVVALLGLLAFFTAPLLRQAESRGAALPVQPEAARQDPVTVPTGSSDPAPAAPGGPSGEADLTQPSAPGSVQSEALASVKPHALPGNRRALSEAQEQEKEKEKEAPALAESPSDAGAPVDPRHAEAERAVQAATANAAAECGVPRGDVAIAQATFGPNGAVINVNIRAPYKGTLVGNCIASKLQGAKKITPGQTNIEVGATVYP